MEGPAGWTAEEQRRVESMLRQDEHGGAPPPGRVDCGRDVIVITLPDRGPGS
ncbi:DUF6191 domain-containing protein [Streptosporangium sp. NPDC050855]|uniref:DUF6191 domain-containing protein n=1 Tax=Streptosporangium sp. NPDC050855 TaxID=3366194 RepID=UPI0037B48404